MHLVHTFTKASENEALRIRAAEMMMVAPAEPKHQHFAIAAALKDDETTQP